MVAVDAGTKGRLVTRIQVGQGVGCQEHEGSQVLSRAIGHRYQGELDHGGEGQKGEESKGHDQGQQGPAEERQTHG